MRMTDGQLKTLQALIRHFDAILDYVCAYYASLSPIQACFELNRYTLMFLIVYATYPYLCMTLAVVRAFSGKNSAGGRE